MVLPKEDNIQTINITEARKNFSETLNRVHRGEQQIVIEKNVIPVAAIVPVSVLQDVEAKERRRQEFLQGLNEARTGFEGVSEEEAEREIAKALQEIKEERRLARRIVSAIVRVQPDSFAVTDETLETTVAHLLKDEEARATLARLGCVDNAE